MSPAPAIKPWGSGPVFVDKAKHVVGDSSVQESLALNLAGISPPRLHPAEGLKAS